ncbi:endo alpha-1,4 polygalactosaminidase [Goodfellowiella coeruleoviolacea]|uniref:endo alpha-1,4 polygalactosaminidase n=1 Tax=Goodfellowiella coeruleoviolacea TaxID=334858 RepID=UPI0020A28FC9|nr:endo alpha-1,4 polygalactosaminidase [Goodfellowiella coeruleoviolacea]
MAPTSPPALAAPLAALVVLVALVGGVLTGCGGGDEPVPPTPPDPPVGPTRSTGPAPPSPAPSSPAPGPTSPTSTGGTESPTGSDRPGTPPEPPAAPARWVPAPGTTWQIQLDGPVDPSVDAQVYEVDGVGASAEDVRALHARGRRVICYVNAGASEDFRPDRAAFPTRVQGNANGWPGERWLDIRQRDLLRPLLAARFDTCRAKGFDAVDTDLVDGYNHDTGFPLTAADQLAYNRMLADLAHERGLSIGLKNDLKQIPDLVSVFDFAVNEQCAEYDECDLLAPFVAEGKAVFHIEYDLEPTEFCPRSRRLNLSSIRKTLDLDARRWTC